jgi:hypothetical protein
VLIGRTAVTTVPTENLIRAGMSDWIG